MGSVTPSFRSFAQAIERQRQSVERIPLLSAARPDLLEVCLALDAAEAAALAISIDEPAAELPALLAVARAVSIPILRVDLIFEEAQIYESRAAGADAVLLYAALSQGETLARLTGAARGTHMSSCVRCIETGEVARAAAARADVIAVEAAHAALLNGLPARALALVLPDGFAHGGAAPVDANALRGKADALLDPSFALAADPAEAFRRSLEE
jgi:indole-3-glycerol phosphate synthase